MKYSYDKEVIVMKKAFTMIELIFVIVIIGILASVAIPKLSSTRDDAKAGQEVSNLSVYIEDITSNYMGSGIIDANHTNVELKCFESETNEINGTITLTISVGGNDDGKEYCNRAQKHALAHNLVGENLVIVGGALLSH